MKTKHINVNIIFYTLLYFLFIAIGVGANPIFSESQIRFITENDGYGGFSDKYYTNGARLEFNTSASEGNWTRAIFGGWNGLFVNEDENTKYLMGIGIGQEFFTPSNISKADISFGDRPYASRVYLGNSLTTWTESSSITTELELGMIGPSVGGKTAQKRFHNYIGSPIPQGWDTQIPDSYSGAIRTDIRKFYHPFFGINSKLNLGNIHIDASFGLIFRLGKVSRNPGPGSSVLSPGSPILHDGQNGYWYFYVNPGGTLKGYDATIEGQMGSNNKFSNGSRNSAFSSSESIFENPDPNFGIEQLVYRQLVEDNGTNALDRYFLFNQFLVQNTENPYGIGLNYLLFNNIFNGSEEIESGFRLVLIENLLGQWNNLTEQEQVVAIYTLFRPQGGRISPLIRYYSYEILSQYILNPAQRLIFLELLRQNIDFSERKTYVAGIKRAVGFIRAGFVHVSDGGFLVSINYNYQTIDYEAADGLPQQHQWLGFQLGTVF